MRIISHKILLVLLLAVGGCVTKPQTLPTVQEQVELANSAIERGDYRRVAEILREILSTEEDTTKAQEEINLNLLRDLARRGSTRAITILGTIYEQGDGVEQDYKVALALYETAASAGDAEAKFLLGGMYYAGRGVEVDRGKTRSLISEAAHQNYVKAQFIYGSMLFSGVGGPADNQAAKMWFRRAAENGDVKSEIFAALAEFETRGQKHDHVEREEWIKYAVWLRLSEKFSLRDTDSVVNKLQSGLKVYGFHFSPDELREIDKRVEAWVEKLKERQSKQK